MRILQLRGDEPAHPETIHAIAACWDDGHPHALDPQSGASGSTWRSTAKPFQLFASLEALGDPDDLPEHLLALGASSHSGQDGHVEGVRAVLGRFGVEESKLRCGAEPPAHRPTAEALLRAGQPWSALHNDCSGKHAFLLAACVQAGLDAETYLSPEHPLQRRIAALLAARTDAPLALSVDGCGLPTAWSPLSGIARAWGHLARAIATPALDPRLARVGRAMAQHPWWVSGDERIDLALARRAREPWVGKIGARGLFTFALPARGLGGALKVLDGDEDALAVAVPALIERIAPGALAPAPDWPWAEIRNVVGRGVGHRLVEG